MLRHFLVIFYTVLLLSIAFSCSDNRPSVTQTEFEKLMVEGKVKQVTFYYNYEEVAFTTDDPEAETKVMLETSQKPELYFRLLQRYKQKDVSFVVKGLIDYKDWILSWGIALAIVACCLTCIGIAVSRNIKTSKKQSSRAK